MKEGEERKAPTHLIEHFKIAHDGRVTKNRTFAGRSSRQLNSIHSTYLEVNQQ